MLRVKPEYYADVDAKMKAFFYESYFAPIMEIIDQSKILKNAASSSLLSAINSGKVKYKDGVFSGTYNMAISRELSRFASFDKRSSTWKGRPPADILSAALNAESKRKKLTDEINRKIDAMSAHVEETIRTLSFGEDLPLFSMNQDVVSDLPSVGVMPELDERTARRFRKDYTESQKLNVKGWNQEQIIRLRDAVEKYQTTSGEESLIDIIQREWQVSANKANFLARQETSLFFSKLSMNRAAVAGVRRYRWSTSHDSRVRDEMPGTAKNAPNHAHLQGEIFDVEGPGGIVDLKTGRRAHPGCDYNCRCAAIWVLE